MTSIWDASTSAFRRIISSRSFAISRFEIMFQQLEVCLDTLELCEFLSLQLGTRRGRFLLDKKKFSDLWRPKPASCDQSKNKPQRNDKNDGENAEKQVDHELEPVNLLVEIGVKEKSMTCFQASRNSSFDSSSSEEKFRGPSGPS
jgi:hypothetical protein